MRHIFIRCLLPVILWVIPLSLHAEASSRVWTPEDFPMVHLEDALRYVCDPENILSNAVRDTIDKLLLDLELSKGIQTVVAVAGNIEGGDAYEFGMGLARKYKIGSKSQNTGLIMVLSTNDRAYYILTGSGLEGVLPDAICSRIERNYMVPRLKQGDWDGALLMGTKALCSYIENDPSLLPDNSSAGEDDKAPWIALFIVIIMMLGLWYSYNNKKRRKGLRCPKCNNHTLLYTGESIQISKADPRKRKYIYRCSHCGYTETRDDNGSGGRKIGGRETLPPFIFWGGLGNRHWGGGSFGGGSFGGGNFGGGGAGGRF